MASGLSTGQGRTHRRHESGAGQDSRCDLELLATDLGQYGGSRQRSEGELAIKVYGDDLKTLEERVYQVVGVMRTVKGIEDLGLFRVIGQPNLNFTVDRD